MTLKRKYTSSARKHNKVINIFPNWEYSNYNEVNGHLLECLELKRLVIGQSTDDVTQLQFPTLHVKMQNGTATSTIFFLAIYYEVK